MIYLDNAATAKYSNVDDVIVDTITNAMKKSWQNPSSLYAGHIKEEINRCRTIIAEFIGAKTDEIIFTSGASESNNMAIRGWVDNRLINTMQMVNIITTPIEHKSILETVKNRALGARVMYCDVDEYGLINLDSLEELLIKLENEPILVSVGLANNEIGTIQPIEEISDLVHSYGGVLHVDATQAIGHIPVNVEKLGIDLMSASGHKISSVLKGIGFLYKQNGVNIQPLIYGNQENGLRGGTENTFGIIGMAKALELCDVSAQEVRELCDKRDYFIDSLKSKFSESGFDIKLNGHPIQRLPNNINITFSQNVTGEALLYMLDMSDIYVSTSSACNSKIIEPSHVLKAIGLSDEAAMRTIRITISGDITYEDTNKVIEEIDKAIKLIET